MSEQDFNQVFEDEQTAPAGLNGDNLAKLIRAIHELPDEQLVMNYWASAKPSDEEYVVPCGNGLPRCGTSYCIAGTAVLLRDDCRLVHAEGAYDLDCQQYDLTLVDAHEEEARWAPGGDFQDLAAEWLGMLDHGPAEEVADAIFCSCSVYDREGMSYITKRDVLRTLAGLYNFGVTGFQDMQRRRRNGEGAVWAQWPELDSTVSAVVAATPSPWKDLPAT